VRKRHDHGADLFRVAFDHLDDADRLRHALLELSRTYDPVGNGPLLPAETRHRIVQLVGQGLPAEARRLLEGALADYTERGAAPETGSGPRSP
jgi:hypothetical protein